MELQQFPCDFQDLSAGACRNDDGRACKEGRAAASLSRSGGRGGGSHSRTPSLLAGVILELACDKSHTDAPFPANIPMPMMARDPVASINTTAFYVNRVRIEPGVESDISPGLTCRTGFCSCGTRGC